MKNHQIDKIRIVTEKDRHIISTLLRSDAYLHQHLDWRSPLDWIGYQPFLLLESNPEVGLFSSPHNRLKSIFACPEEPSGVAWVRVFLVPNQKDYVDLWKTLWQETQKSLIGFGFSGIVAAIPMENWFRKILEGSNFSHTHDVVGLSWGNKKISGFLEHSGKNIRRMNWSDLPAVQLLDQAAFPGIWRYSLSTLSLGFQHAIYSTVIEEDSSIIGYQMTTNTHGTGCHLARLAVKPENQSKGLGYFLIADMLTKLSLQGYSVITVNTQHNNAASLALYDKMGFKSTGDRYPVYELNIR